MESSIISRCSAVFSATDGVSNAILALVSSDGPVGRFIICTIKNQCRYEKACVSLPRAYSKCSIAW